jgi:hypothetical protein
MALDLIFCVARTCAYTLVGGTIARFPAVLMGGIFFSIFFIV